MMWGFRRVRQLLVIPVVLDQKKRGSALLRGLQESERQEERLFPTTQY
jgi:hypothetical protein